MNNRVFQAQALVTNGIALGGLSTIRFNAAYTDVVVSSPDGAFGSEDVDRAGLRIGVSMDVSDVSRVLNILNGTPGLTSWSCKESGASTYSNYSISATDGVILWTGMRMSLSKNQDGRLSLDGVIRFADGAKDLEDIIKLTAGQTAPTLTYPLRYYRPNTFSFDPDGADPAILPLHLESLQLALSARVIQRYSDTDVGHIAVDTAGWNPLQVTAVHEDSSDVSPGDVASSLAKAGRGVLNVALQGRGGGSSKNLIVNNLLWTGVDKQEREDYSDRTQSGFAGWKNGATVYDLNGAGTPLFNIA